jgi:hypothetical protein
VNDITTWQGDNPPLDWYRYNSFPLCVSCLVVPLTDARDVFSAPGIEIVACAGCGSWVDLADRGDMHE